eukprot:CAMPEP_0173240926 /NCGR_PEP_ID=MMETSP1142-20121109/14066_1 /TAXON_ID=483371 /ORGANISM="non described non described, Strain CCMP2298" /LENGTH=138 /DNA_ID=CAMNT_0014172159 /DNA_START=30 /DNA_END=446 /DNA_ORIENTATION=+
MKALFPHLHCADAEALVMKGDLFREPANKPGQPPNLGNQPGNLGNQREHGNQNREPNPPPPHREFSGILRESGNGREMLSVRLAEYGATLAARAKPHATASATAAASATAISTTTADPPPLSISNTPKIAQIPDIPEL